MRFDEQFVSIGRLALAGAARFPDLEAIVDGDLRITYPQLADEVVRSTRAAMAAGIEPGDRAAVWAPNSASWIIAALGVLGAGGVLVTLNTRFRGGEAAYVLRKSGAKLLFTVNGFLDTDYAGMLRAALSETGETLPELARVVLLDGTATADDRTWAEHLAGAATVTEDDARARIEAIDGDDLADIMFTSGTTGRPKGAMSTHAQNLRVYEVWSEVVGLREGDRYLVVNPFFHGFGYKAGWFASIMRGATIVPLPVFDVAQVLERVQSERITVLPGPPTLLAGILEFPDRDRYDLSSLRLTVTGAAVVPVELIRRLRSEMAFETIITGYGLTETTGTVSMCRYDDDPETIANFSGRAIPDTELRIVDGDGVEVARGEPGEVVTRGYHVMQGYFGDDAETAATVDADGWLHTGDIGIMDERGYIRITDRLKDMYIVGGFNAYPAEIEGLLLEFEKLAQVAVIGVPDARLGEVGMAFVVPRTGTSVDADEVVAWAREHMANYKVPRHVEVCRELPVNANGKVVKYELRERATSRPG
jgi:acyl-CoA synthetase (AMP-forming)/AMP-acid ligase II